MVSDLESTLGISSQTRDWQAEPEIYRAIRSGLYQGGFLTIWELQSQLATVTLIALVAFAPIVLTLTIMICWSLAATLVYYHGRKRGLPDVFDARWELPPFAPRRWSIWLAGTSLSLGKAWLAGVQPFLYAKATSRLLASPAGGCRTRLSRATVLALGLVLFGVTAAHHLLRQSGLPDAKVLRLCVVGSFLNVTYRVLLSALVINTLAHLAGPVLG